MTDDFEIELRNLPPPPEYPHRNYREDLAPNQIENLVRRLRDLAEATDPAGGEATAKGKDLRAFEAIGLAMMLVDRLAGWAIDHQIGLAAAGLEFVPIQPQQTRGLPDNLEKLAAVDSHEHEREGAKAFNAVKLPDTAEFQRKALINLIRAMANQGTWAVFRPAEEALRALEYNEVLPILQPVVGKRKVRYRAMHLQLKAIGYIEFHAALGMKKFKAQEMVGSAFGISGASIRNWEVRLREEAGVGRLRVSQEQAWAKNAAGIVLGARNGTYRYPTIAAEHARKYGEKAIARDGAAFKDAQRENED